MANLIGKKSGVIVLETNKGLLQIYIKDGKSIVTLESSRNLVTYAKNFEMNGVISPFASIVSSILPNNLALKVIGHEFGKRENIVLEDNNESLTLHNEGIKKGDKVVNYTTYNNVKVDNLFDEYDRNPDIFSGFCNYKIDSLGNIDDRELDLLKKSFTPKYSLLDLINGNEKTREALVKESATERYLEKIYKDYAKEHDDELDDIQRIGFKKIKNLFSEVNDSLKDGKKEDMLDTLERAKTTIVARNSSIPNIMEYINDSRIEGNYTQDDVNKSIGMIYVLEKLKLYNHTQAMEEKFKSYEADPKLMKILCEDIVASYKKVERVNFEDMLPIQFVRTREKIMDVQEKEQVKIDGVLKRYVDLLESMNFESKDERENDSDELGIIVKNYENYLEEGVLSSLGFPQGDGFITMFRNSIKDEVVKQKVNCDDIITFSQLEGDNENDSATKHEYNYIIKNEKVNIFKDNQDCGMIEELELREKYEKYVDPQEIKKYSLSRIANKTHFIFMPGDEGITTIEQEYRTENIVNDTIYMIKTIEQDKDIPRKAYLKDISQHLDDSSQKSRDLDMEEVIYNNPAKDILNVIQKEFTKDEDEIILSEDDLEEVAELIDETGEVIETQKDEAANIEEITEPVLE
ncbi:MAG: hypothetical protein MJ245_03660 [Clostridia bacterium]|nr:hypothetical protein [Clostridia bacterium]